MILFYNYNYQSLNMDDLQKKKKIDNQLQGGSHREVKRHMPSAALFKVKAMI